MAIIWPDYLIEDIAYKRCVIFLGSGISMNSQSDDGKCPPSWKKFLEDGINLLSINKKNKHADIAQKYLDKNDLLMACQVVRHGLEKNDFNTLLKNKSQTPKYKRAEIHCDIFDLDSNIVITPNFDKIYDSYAQSESNGTIVVKQYSDNDILDCIRRKEPLIIKMHGSIDSPDSLIFSRADYAKIWNVKQNFYRLIDSLMLTHTFLFLGAGLEDPDVRLMMESISYTYAPTRHHVFVISDDSLDDISQEIYSNILGLKFLTYSHSDNHQELKESIKELNTLVSPLRPPITPKV